MKWTSLSGYIYHKSSYSQYTLFNTKYCIPHSFYISAICPSDFIKLPEVGSCYKLVSDDNMKRGHQAAEDECQSYNRYAHLVTIDNDKERVFLGNILSREPRRLLVYSAI